MCQLRVFVVAAASRGLNPAQEVGELGILRVPSKLANPLLARLADDVLRLRSIVGQEELVPKSVEFLHESVPLVVCCLRLFVHRT